MGGNSLIKSPERRSVPDQYEAICETAVHVVDMIEEGWRVVLTHGNGPQVGFILLRSELTRHSLHEVPLDSCVADTQGAIGYQFQNALGNEFRRRGMKNRTATLVTRVIVDRDDPAFARPSKPIGPFMDENTARIRQDEGWVVAEDAGRGWRRVVPSPMPREIVEMDALRALVEAGLTVIACGGGGIPVRLRPDGTLEGVAAVVDKDHASSLLARSLRADAFVITTAVDRVYLHFGTEKARGLDTLTAAQARRYAEEGHFSAGSMLPKVQASVAYLEGGGKLAVITSPENLGRALRGEAGTRLVPA